MNYINNKRLVGWSISLITLIVYILCLPKTITFWDSPEFVASSFTLQNSHPPGAPFYTLIGSIVTGIFGNSHAAYITNLLSAIFGALTIKYLFDVIYFISKKINNSSYSHEISIISGILGALSFAFCTSFWTASTETEVYTLSFLLLIVIFWISIKWHETSNSIKEKKLLLLLFFLLGISLGVHQINTAIVFPLTLLYFHKKIGFKVKHIVLACLLGVTIFILLFSIFFQGIISLTYLADFFFVNNLSFPVNKGAIFFLSFILLLLLLVSYISFKKKYYKFHLITLSLFFFFIGSSSYLTTIIRSDISASISNEVKTFNKLHQYVKAEQFGVNNIPLLKGYTFNAPLDDNTPFLDGKVKYSYNGESKKYEVIDDGKYNIENYDDKFSLLFPRIYHQSNINANGYKTWTTIKGEPITHNFDGKPTTIYKPKFHENLSFFFNYQINWLYTRYLFKNFIGNQNDLSGKGNIFRGNWKSGFNFIDKYRIGDQKIIPNYYKTNNSNDSYYFLPFLLGIWGIFLLRKNKLFFITIILLFLTFGIGIIIYVNPVPQSILIRERDYIFTASFMFFSIWIGISFNGIYSFLKLVTNHKLRLILASTLAFIASPIQLLAKGIDNHNRNHEKFAYELGKAFLKDCPKQAILITNGDNLTFPLWYLQEVEKFRADVRVVNYEQLLLDWYVEKLQVKTNNSEALSLKIPLDFNKSASNLIIPLKKQTDKYLNIKNLSSFLSSPLSKLTWKEKKFYALPTYNFLLPVNQTYNLNENLSLLRAKKTDTLRWSFPKENYAKNDLILFDIIANNFENRPICFSETGNDDYKFGLSKYLVQKGMLQQLLPIERILKSDNPKIVETNFSYKNLVEKSSFTPLDNINSKVNYETIGISKNILRRNFYFLAQGLLEKKDTLKAIRTIDYATTLIPNKTVPFNEFSFALGKLYYRAKKLDKGHLTCKESIQNIEDEIKAIVSFNPPRPIINVRYLNRILNIYKQMVNQLENLDPQLANLKKRELTVLENSCKKWVKANWPY